MATANPFPDASSHSGGWARLVRAAKAGVDAQEFAWLPPWHRGRNERERAVRRIRAAALRLIRAQQSDRNVARPSVIRSLAWPALLPVKAWQSARIPGRPGFGRRFLSGVLDLTRYNLRPGALRSLRELRPDDRRLGALYVADLENQALLQHLHRAAPNRVLGDKVLFADFCRRHGLSHVPLLAHGTGKNHTRLADWPASDLFAKPANLYGGQGAEMLHYDPAQGSWTDSRGRVSGPDDLVGWAAATYGEQPWLIQPRLHVDPAWAGWSSRALVTVRITTVMVRPGDAPEVIISFLRVPRAGMVVDNLAAGGMPAEIDRVSGILGPATAKKGACSSYDHHPDGGAPITGVAVPGWAEMCRLACAAHAAVPDLTAVGWDVASHHGTPVLLEANPVFNLYPMAVLGETRWLEALLHREDDLAPDTHFHS